MALDMQFSNGTPSTWNRSHWGGTTQLLTEWIVKTPVASMPKFGMAEYEIDESMKLIATGDSNIYCSWTNGQYWFGIQIIFPFQMFHMGYSPYYQVAGSVKTPTSLEAISWRDPTNDNPAFPYDFSAQKDKLPEGLSIHVSPTASGQALSLLVTISGK